MTVAVVAPIEVEVVDLDALAETARVEYQRSRDALGQSIDGYLACGRALDAARWAFASNQAFGEWFNIQKFGFNRQWAHVLRQAAQHEQAVRDAFASQLADGANTPNLQRAVKTVRAALKTPDSPPVSNDTPTKPDKSQEGTRIREQKIRELAAQGYNRDQIAESIGVTRGTLPAILKRMGLTSIPADGVFGRGTRKPNSVRILTETTHALEGLLIGVRLIEFADLESIDCSLWYASLDHSVRSFRQFLNAFRDAMDGSPE